MDTRLSFPTTDAASRLRFGVTGMTCASCVDRLEKALAQVPGVQSASVNLATETARVQVIAGTLREALAAAIAAAGYEGAPVPDAHTAYHRSVARATTALSSVRVLSNTLLLQRWAPRPRS